MTTNIYTCDLCSAEVTTHSDAVSAPLPTNWLEIGVAVKNKDRVRGHVFAARHVCPSCASIIAARRPAPIYPEPGNKHQAPGRSGEVLDCALGASALI